MTELTLNQMNERLKEVGAILHTLSQFEAGRSPWPDVNSSLAQLGEWTCKIMVRKDRLLPYERRITKHQWLFWMTHDGHGRTPQEAFEDAIAKFVEFRTVSWKERQEEQLRKLGKEPRPQPESRKKLTGLTLDDLF